MKKSFVLVLLLSAFLIQDVLAKDESVPQRVGESVKKGGEAAGRGIKKGGEATVKGVKKAGKWIGKKVHKDGEKSEKVSK
ncbi:MAG: hypothetical protein Q7T38_11115 [Gallionella sp.]|nr:hypothetical protein [Gallionella sp.]